jgi:Nuclear transport factor 2 (NTF2) domain
MMSGPNSGTSTPRNSMTPTPPDGGGGGGANAASSTSSSSSPNPLTVGTHFVKQYYKVLSTTPDQIFRFYQPTSVLSQGVGSQLPTQPSTLEASGMDAVKDRFVLPGFEGCPIRFEFEHGAIDAQISVNGGVLLVVTGHLLYVDSAPDQDGGGSAATNNNNLHRGEDCRKAFVHTFFLGSQSTGTKRSYYVHNDILRFLNDPADVEERTVVASNISPRGSKQSASPTVSDDGALLAAAVAAPLPSAVETNHVAALEPESAAAMQKLSLDAPNDVAPGGGVEESKDVVLEEEVQPDADSYVPGGSQWSSAAGTPGAKEDEQKSSAPRPTPGSWASLVASGTNSTPATPTRASAVTPVRAGPSAATKPVPSSPAVKAAAAPALPAATTTSLSGAPAAAVPAATSAPDVPPRPAKQQHVKRDPDCTLVIKNIDPDTKEADVMVVFEAFAAKTDAKVVGMTVSGHKGIAFVDYDSAAPVLAAVAQHGKEPLQLNGRELDIYQKTLEKMNRKASGKGGSFRGGGAPGNGSASGAGRGGGDRGGGGGRKPYGRGGRNDRGERGGGGRGGR